MTTMLLLLSCRGLSGGALVIQLCRFFFHFLFVIKEIQMFI